MLFFPNSKYEMEKLLELSGVEELFGKVEVSDEDLDNFLQHTNPAENTTIPVQNESGEVFVEIRVYVREIDRSCEHHRIDLLGWSMAEGHCGVTI